MAAPKNNKNGVGNNGGWSYSAEFREKQVELKRLVILEMIRIMQSKEVPKCDKMEVIKIIGRNVIPKEVESTNETRLTYVINEGSSDRPMATTSESEINNEQSAEIQGDEVREKVRQDDSSNR